MMQFELMVRSLLLQRKVQSLVHNRSSVLQIADLCHHAKRSAYHYHLQSMTFGKQYFRQPKLNIGDVLKTNISICYNA